VPYAWKKLLAYMVIVVLLFFVHKGVTHLYSAYLFKIITGLLLLLAFALFILKIEKREFQRLPFIGKYLR
jgi:hypothetical protein